MNTTCKLWKRLTAYVLAIALILSTLLIPNVSANAATGSITSVAVSNLPSTSLTMKAGATFQIKPKVTKTGTVSTAVTYKSSQTTIATVSSAGVITAIKAGKYTITITSKADTSKALR